MRKVDIGQVSLIFFGCSQIIYHTIVVALNNGNPFYRVFMIIVWCVLSGTNLVNLKR